MLQTQFSRIFVAAVPHLNCSSSNFILSASFCICCISFSKCRPLFSLMMMLFASLTTYSSPPHWKYTFRLCRRTPQSEVFCAVQAGFKTTQICKANCCHSSSHQHTRTIAQTRKDYLRALCQSLCIAIYQHRHHNTCRRHNLLDWHYPQ